MHRTAILCLCFSAAVAAGQTERALAYKEIPAAVRSAFEKQFAGARVLGASTEAAPGGAVFEVECEYRSRRHDVTFRADGSLVSIEETIPMSEVPAAVAAALRKEFPEARVTLAEKITMDGSVSYEFQLKGAAKREVKYSPEGKLLSSE